MESNFDACLKEILKHEGGYVNHPKDPGGMTNLGVTKRVYEQYLGRKVDEAAMRALKPADVKPLYKKMFWDKMRCGELPVGLDLLVFDFGVNAGPNRSIKYLQRMVGVDADGIIGPATMLCVESFIKQFGKEKAVTKFSEARISYYKKLPTFATFGKGWLRRVDEVQKKGLVMAKSDNQ